MNTKESIITTPQSSNHIVKPFKFPPQPQEWKIVSLKEWLITNERRGYTGQWLDIIETGLNCYCPITQTPGSRIKTGIRLYATLYRTKKETSPICCANTVVMNESRLVLA